MKTLRAKIVLFVALLIILPSLPLTYFVLQLLDRSYRIGVNEHVETALDGALAISADLYQIYKNRFDSVLHELLQTQMSTPKQMEQFLTTRLDSVRVAVDNIHQLDKIEHMFYHDVVDEFLHSNTPLYIWPSPEHTRLHGLALMNNTWLIQVRYPLPLSFRRSARHIQDVNQIYKTLGYVRSDLRHSFLITFLIIYGLVILMSLLVLTRISKTITRPVQELTAATRQIGRGDLTHQVHISGHDEFAQLAHAFNTMVRELDTHQRKILELEKMAAWQQLARRLAHEIKNPLTPIQLMAQQMRDMYHGDDEAYRATLQQCAEIIDDEVNSLKRLVREFSDFARLPEFHIQTQPLRPLLDTICSLYGNVDIRITGDWHECIFPFDGDYLKRALINLIDNAIAAGDEQPHITIHVETNSDSIRLQVMDEGSGIADEHLTKIFEPYFSSKRTGVGLGLPIVKRIIEEHGGTIHVESTPGQGTTFTMTFPNSSGKTQ